MAILTVAVVTAGPGGTLTYLPVTSARAHSVQRTVGVFVTPFDAFSVGGIADIARITMNVGTATRAHAGIVDAHFVNARARCKIAKSIVGVGALIVAAASGEFLAKALAVAFFACAAGLVADANA